MILSTDGKDAHDTTLSGSVSQIEDLGRRAAKTVREAAGPGFFEQWA